MVVFSHHHLHLVPRHFLKSFSSSADCRVEPAMEGSGNQVEPQRQAGIRYCVTGATGYIGSWLVRSLLQRGYKVHGTVREPMKASSFLPIWGGEQDGRLKVFKADLQEEGSFDEAIKGCHGVFHVAHSMEFNVPAQENIESYVQSNILDPAVKGTLNLLNACLRAKSVKRVVLTSSISTMTAKDSNGNWKPIVDESCQTPVDHVWKAKASGWIYVLSKLVSEEAAFKFANENGIDLVSVITTTVAGPFLTPTVPSSVRVLLSPITGESEFNSILCAVLNRMGSVAIVHVEDICNAHIFLMEKAAAEGRYICSAHSFVMPQLQDTLTREYLCVERSCDQPGSAPSEISSKKLKDLGFEYKYGFEETIKQSISFCVQNGFLSHPA